MEMDTKKELDVVCSRLALLIKAGKKPIDYEKKWEEFRTKKAKK